MSGVALFVDHENIFIGLKEWLGIRSPDRNDPAAKAAYQAHNQMLAATLAAGLRREAEKLGPLRAAFAIANFQQYDFFHHPGIYAQCGFEPRYNVAGRNSADTFITNLVNEVVSDSRFSDVDTYVLVSGDGGYFYVVKMLLDQQRQVRVWGITGHTSHLMQGISADSLTVDYVDQLIDFGPVQIAASVVNRAARPAPASSPGRPGAVAPAAAPEMEKPLAPLPPPSTRVPHGLSDLQVLIALFDEHLAGLRLDFLSPRLSLDFLERYKLGSPDEATRSRYLHDVLQIGVLKEEKIWLGDRDGLRILPNAGNEMVARYRQVRSALFSPALIKPLHPTDGFRPKRSFVVSTISRAVTGIEAEEIHRWLDWFVQRNLLVSTYERLPKDTQAANILKMNPEHSMVQALLAGAVWERIATPLLVLTVDSLQRVPRRPWVALSLLLRHIGDQMPVSREDLRVAVGKALQQGLLIKLEYPNPRRPEPTSGVHLGDAPEVQQIMDLGREFVSRAVEMARPTGQVPISYLIQQCAASGLCGGDFDHIKDEITVLEKAGLLLLRAVPHPVLQGQTMTVVSPDGLRCRAMMGEVAALPASIEPHEAAPEIDPLEEIEEIATPEPIPVQSEKERPDVLETPSRPPAA